MLVQVYKAVNEFISNCAGTMRLSIKNVIKPNEISIRIPHSLYEK